MKRLMSVLLILCVLLPGLIPVQSGAEAANVFDDDKYGVVQTVSGEYTFEIREDKALTCYLRLINLSDSAVTYVAGSEYGYLQAGENVRISQEIKAGAGFKFYAYSRGEYSVCVCRDGHHSPNAVYHTVLEPDCTHDGGRALVCAGCGQLFADSYEVIPASHTPGEWETRLEPTGDAPGVRSRSCIVCGELLETELFTLSGESLSPESGGQSGTGTSAEGGSGTRERGTPEVVVTPEREQRTGEKSGPKVLSQEEADAALAEIDAAFISMQDYLLFCGYEDAYSPEAIAAGAEYLEANGLVKETLIEDGVLLILSNDGVPCLYYDTPDDAAGAVTASEAYEAYTSGLSTADMTVLSSIAPTNNNLQLMVFAPEDSVMSEFGSFATAFLNDFSNDKGGLRFISLTDQDARDCIESGEYTDCGLLLIGAHGGRIYGRTFFEIDHVDTNDVMGCFDQVSEVLDLEPSFLMKWGLKFDKVVTYKYLEQYIGDRLFDNTVVQLFICYAAMDQELIDFFLDRGATAVIACSDPYKLQQAKLDTLRITTALYDDIYAGVRSRFEAGTEYSVRDELSGIISRMHGASSQQHMYTLLMSQSLNGQNDANHISMYPAGGGDPALYGTAEGSISGKVYANKAVAPKATVEHARIRLFRWLNHNYSEYKMPELYTDKNGMYEISDLPFGVYAVQAELGEQKAYQTLFVVSREDGNDVNDIDLELTYSGRVVDANGIPCAGVDVSLDAASAVFSIWTDTTDENGVYRFVSTDGTYTASVVYEGEKYSSTASLTLGHDMQMPDIVVGRHTFQGRVFTQTNGDNRAVSGAYVEVEYKENGRYKPLGRMLVTDEKGVYRFSGKYGDYRFKADFAGYTDTVEATLDEDTNGAPNLLCGVSLAGTIRNEVTGKPINAVIVTVTHADGTQDGTVSGTDGFYLINAQNGEAVSCNYTGAGYESKDVVFSSAYTKNGSYYTADVTLRPAETLLSGTVTDRQTKQPISGADVCIRAADGTLLASGVTNFAGKWEIRLTSDKYINIKYCTATKAGYTLHKHYVGANTLADGSFKGFNCTLTKLASYDFLLVVDTSGSMSGTPISTLRQTASQLVNDLFDRSADSYLSLMEYNTGAYTISGFVTSGSRGSILSSISNLSSGGNTAMAAALARARESAISRKAALDAQGLKNRRICVIFMSDGQPTDSLDSVYREADRLHALGYVDVYSVGFLHDVSPAYRKECEDVLRYIAGGGGKFYNVTTSYQFSGIFSDILDTLTKSQRVIVTVDCPVDVSVTFLGETLDANNTRTSFGTLQFEGAGNERKVLRLDAACDYRINMTGTGSGFMDYTLQHTDEYSGDTYTSKIVGIPVVYGMTAYSDTEETGGAAVYASTDGRNYTVYSAADGEKVIYNDHSPSIAGYSSYWACTASSYHEPNDPPVSPGNLVDGDIDSSWDSWGDREGAWVQLAVTDGYEYKFSGFSINNGKSYGLDKGIYQERNCRVKDCSVYIDGVLVGSFTLRDGNAEQSVVFPSPVTGSVFKLVIDSVYKGSRYTDPDYGVCIAELRPF